MGVPFDVVVAFGQCGQYVGMVYFGLFDVGHLSDLGRGDREVVDALLVAAVLQVGESEREVRGDQSEV